MKRCAARKTNIIDVRGEVAFIVTTNGLQIVVDADALDLVRLYRWYARKLGTTWYAMTTTRPVLLIHRLITGVTTGEVDHINGDGLDNRRENLRVVTRSQNQRNRVSVPGTSSRFKGVSRSKTSVARPWVAQAKGRWLGRFACEEEAARAYDAMARERYGRYAALNFPGQGEQSALRLRKAGES